MPEGVAEDALGPDALHLDAMEAATVRDEVVGSVIAPGARDDESEAVGFHQECDFSPFAFAFGLSEFGEHWGILGKTGVRSQERALTQKTMRLPNCRIEA